MKVKTLLPDLLIGDTCYPKGSTVDIPDDRAVFLAEQGAVAFVEVPKNTLEGTEADRAKLSRKG